MLEINDILKIPKCNFGIHYKKTDQFEQKYLRLLAKYKHCRKNGSFCGGISMDFTLYNV